MRKKSTGSSVKPRKPKIAYVNHLPDLINEDDYHDAPEKKKVRIRISMTGNGVEILGDSMHAALLEQLLARTGAKEIQRTLCG